MGLNSRQIIFIIENKAGLMINFILEIGERKTSLTRFDIKVKNKKGEEETFPPVAYTSKPQSQAVITFRT